MLSTNSSENNPKSPSATTTNTSSLLSPNNNLTIPAAGGDSVINPFTQRQAIKTRRVKRQQGSSRFINEQHKELEQLPAIKG